MDRRTFVKVAGAGAATTLGVRRGWAGAVDEPNVSAIAHDPLRPAYHLMPPHQWMNDPNGPIYWKGKYHLFYQLNPHAAVWGDMHWGHAVSPDMVRWKHLPVALAPTPGGADGEGCFSGSAVVLQGNPAFIYTGVQNAPREEATIRDGSDKLRETQMVAFAEDDGLLHWKKDETPVIATPPPGMRVTGFRDPCPWKEPDGWYVGVGSGERGKGGCVLLYRSQDFRHWEYLHPLVWGKPNGKQAANPCDSGEMWECPDFFALGHLHYLQYSTENKVIWTTGEYNREAHTYTPRRTGLLDQGPSYYAPKSFVAADGRRIMWGWLRETRPEAEFAAAGWAGVMSLPRVFSVGAQGQLEMHPAQEVESLRGASEKATVTAGTPWRHKLSSLQQEVHLPVGLFGGKSSIRLLVGGAPVWDLSIDPHANEIRCGELKFPLPGMPYPQPGVRMFLDGSVVEVFIGGREAITSRVYTVKPGETELEVALGGKGKAAVQVWAMTPISPDRLTI